MQFSKIQVKLKFFARVNSCEMKTIKYFMRIHLQFGKTSGTLLTVDIWKANIHNTLILPKKFGKYARPQHFTNPLHGILKHLNTPAELNTFSFIPACLIIQTEIFWGENSIVEKVKYKESNWRINCAMERAFSCTERAV